MSSTLLLVNWFQQNQQITLLAILLVLLILLIWGKWRYDIVALIALFVAGITGVVNQAELFSGFGHPATITVVLVLILSYGLTQSGAVEIIAELIKPLSDRPFWHIGSLTFVAAFLSMFMNNVGALALLMPIAIKSSQAAGRPPATVLMPLSFGSILGGLVTQIGTPPNILVANYRLQETGEGFSMFDFSPVGGGVAVCGILFILLVGWKLVRVRKKTAGLELFDIEGYLFELRVPESSKSIDDKLGNLQADLRERGADLIMLVHKGKHITRVYNDRNHQLQKNDLICVQGRHEQVEEFARERGLELLSAQNAKQEILRSADTKVAEVVVTPNSPVVGKTPADLRFNRRFGVNLLAVSRAGKAEQTRLRNLKMAMGDVLLLHGGEEEIQDAIRKLKSYPLLQRTVVTGDRLRAGLALGTFALAVLVAATGLATIHLALGVATVVMALLKILSVEDFYEGVDWPVIILLGAMIPLGSAMETSGFTETLVTGISGVAGDLSPALLIALLLIITMTVSDVLNNAATAILMAPLAYNMALSLQYSPDPFLMAVAVGASCAFLTPIGHQNNALIMGAGGYKFSDYWRMGLPLEIVIVIVAVPLLLLFWPL